MSERSYYCSNKFKYIKIDLERQMTYNCHAATPHVVDFNWLSENPGNIFNSPVSVAERKQMLLNQRNRSCEQNCWPSEDLGKSSTRIVEFGVERTHTEPVTQPTILDVTLDSDCNMSCVYCCKEFSSAWRREVSNGGYQFPFPTQDIVNRYTVNTKDTILSNLSQAEKQSSKRHQQLKAEFDTIIPGLKTLIITGGEPLLSTQLKDLVNKACAVPLIQLYSGLGVSPQRLSRVLESFDYTDNITFVISAETVGPLYEFVRYGNSYENLLNNIEVLKKKNIKFIFHSTISNLTLPGFVEFYNTHWNDNSDIDFSNTPSFFAPNVLDPVSKDIINAGLDTLSGKYIKQIQQSIEPTPTEEDRINLAYILKELSNRRQLSLEFYPRHFLDWIYS